jgi:hypothetical protein
MSAICRSLFICVTCYLALGGCGGAVYRYPSAPTGEPASPPPLSKLMIFGADDHKTYLGCLSCSEYSTDSVFNKYGSHGSRYSAESVWNQYSEFGSRYSSYGTCNPYASDPPVIVDSEGTFYGRLTLNAYHAQLRMGANYHDWLLSKVCE